MDESPSGGTQAAATVHAQLPQHNQIPTASTQAVRFAENFVLQVQDMVSSAMPPTTGVFSCVIHWTDNRLLYIFGGTVVLPQLYQAVYAVDYTVSMLNGHTKYPGQPGSEAWGDLHLELDLVLRWIRFWKPLVDWRPDPDYYYLDSATSKLNPTTLISP